jgi:hypothetical protein
MQKLGQDRPRIAPRPVERGVRDDFQQSPGVLLALRQGGAHGSQRDGEVGAGIAVRDRKHINAIEMFRIGDDAGDAGQQSARKPLSVKVSDAGRRDGPSLATAGSACPGDP